MKYANLIKPGQSVGPATKVASAVKANVTLPTGRKAAAAGPVVVITGSLTLAAPAMTSAGVFNALDRPLRTIWGNVSKPAGAVAVKWDGKDDFGNDVPAGSYTIKLVSHNINVIPRGIIGNTTYTGPGSYGNGLNFNYRFTESLVITPAGVIYQADQYAELKSSVRKWRSGSILLSDPLQGNGADVSVTDLAEDGTKVFQLAHKMDQGRGDGRKSPESCVTANVISTGARHTFSAGSTINPIAAQAPISCAAYRDSEDWRPRGIGVLRTGNLLFVAYPGQNSIQVHNKNTGAFVSAQTVPSPSGMYVDYSERLWLITNNTVTRYAVDATTGALTSQLSLTGLVKPLAVTVSKDNTLVAVCDGAASQQVKFYNASTGAASGAALGEANGYVPDPTVSTSKFYFSDAIGGISKPYVAFDTAGGFWVGDVGNYRSLHFNSSRTYVEQVAWHPNNYSVYVDPNNPSRVFCQFLEYNVDYSKTMTQAGAWTLVKNYRAPLPASSIQLNNIYQNIEFRGSFRNVTTVMGRTYALSSRQDQHTQVVEIPASGHIRFTPHVFAPGSSVYLMKDGSLHFAVLSQGVLTITRRVLTSIDGSGNPVWATATTLASLPAGSADPVQKYGGPVVYTQAEDGTLITMDEGALTVVGSEVWGGNEYHLGGITPGVNAWKWRGALATHRKYEGEYPLNGQYDIGNLVKYGAGEQLTSVGPIVVWIYHGENWRDSQTFKIHPTHVATGLPLGCFGKTAHESEATGDWDGNGGNVFYIQCVKLADGRIMFWYGMESPWGGAGLGEITGVDSIQVQSVAATVTIEADPRGTPIFADLPRMGEPLINGQYGISRSATDAGEYQIRSGVRVAVRNLPGTQPDFFCRIGNLYDATLKEHYGYKQFNTSTGLNNWALQFNYEATQFVPNNLDYPAPMSQGGYMRLLDTTGKILVQYKQVTLNGSTA